MRRAAAGNQKLSQALWPGVPPGEDPYRQLIDSVSDYAIFLLDRDGIIRSWNAGAERIKGFKAAEIVGRSVAVLHTRVEADRGQPTNLLESAADRGRASLEGWRVRRDGTRFWADTVVTALYDRDGDLYGYAVITRDLTQTREQEEELRRSQDRSRRFWTAAISDALTGAFNRRYLNSHLRGAIDRGEHAAASLLLFDVDHFKEINDQHGHDAGDLVLRRIAEVARQISRDSDMLFRLGGDEFVIYLPGVNAAGATAIAHRLRQAVSASSIPGGRRVTISVGVAQGEAGDTLDGWIRRADVALYQAKQGGRDRVV